jgi:hypothetical protein
MSRVQDEFGREAAKLAKSSSKRCCVLADEEKKERVDNSLVT